MSADVDQLPPGFRSLGGLVVPESVRVPDTLAELESETTAPLDVVDLRERLIAAPRESSPRETSSVSASDRGGAAHTAVEEPAAAVPPADADERGGASTSSSPPTSTATTAPSAAPLEPPAPPPLTVPPRPQRKTSPLVEWWATAFPQLIWLAVIAGLTGQIYGWTQEFGGTPIAIGVAVVLGGTFEFIMVAASSRGLRDIGEGRPIWQAGIFLAAATACAGLAVYMALSHFTGNLEMAGRAAAAATAIGYLAHVCTHLFDELDNRTTLRQWQQRRDEIQREIDARESAARAAHDAMQQESLASHTEEIRRRRAEQAKAVEQAPVDAAEPATKSTSPSRSSNRAAKDKHKSKAPRRPQLTREMAVAWSEKNGQPGPSAVIRHFREQGYDTRSVATVRRWLNSPQG